VKMGTGRVAKQVQNFSELELLQEVAQ